MGPAIDMQEDRDEFKAVRNLLDSILDLYAPGLKQKIISFEKTVEDLTHFSGAICLNGKEDTPGAQLLGEARVGSLAGDQKDKEVINWSIKTSLDFDSGAIGMELWKETDFVTVTLVNELKQDFSDELAYNAVIKMEKVF